MNPQPNQDQQPNRSHGLRGLRGGPAYDRECRERGSLTLEAAVLAPVLVLILGFIIAAGRITIAAAAVEEAARDAARQASVSLNATEAKTSATAAATSTLRRQGLNCTHRSVTVNTSGFRRPPGTPAAVTATVRCTVRLSDLAIPGLPGSRTLTATHDSPIDTYRDRG